MTDTTGHEVQHIEFGVVPAKLNPVRIRFVILERPFPSDDLLRIGRSFRRGHWGFMREASRARQRYEERSFHAVKQALGHNTIVVLPELAGSQNLTDRIAGVLKEGAFVNCFAVAGSYYAMRDDKVANIAPIIAPDGKIYEQFKFDPAPAEKAKGCEPHHAKPLLLFRDTGFGNFAVVICSDGLTVRLANLRLALRKDLDLLIVPARNRASDLPNQLKDLAADEGIVVAYCNGLGGKSKSVDSCVFTPLRKTPVMRRSQSGNVIDIPYIRGQLSSKTARNTRHTDGFDKRKVQWPASTRYSPIVFQKEAKVLAIGSHFDDIWMGCSATLMLLRERHDAQIVCADLCDQYPHPYFGKFRIGDRQTHLDKNVGKLCAELGFRYECDWNKEEWVISDRSFAEAKAGLSNRIGFLAARYGDADLVFVPRHDDYHEDHSLTTKEVLKRFTTSTILEYEIKEFRRGPFHPSLIVDVTGRSKHTLRWNGTTIWLATSGSFAMKKAVVLNEIIASILHGCDMETSVRAERVLPNTFAEEHILGRLAIRASEFGMTAKYAEAFATDIIIS